MWPEAVQKQPGAHQQETVHYCVISITMISIKLRSVSAALYSHMTHAKVTESVKQQLMVYHVKGFGQIN